MNEAASGIDQCRRQLNGPQTSARRTPKLVVLKPLSSGPKELQRFESPSKMLRSRRERYRLRNSGIRA